MLTVGPRPRPDALSSGCDVGMEVLTVFAL